MKSVHVVAMVCIGAVVGGSAAPTMAEESPTVSNLFISLDNGWKLHPAMSGAALQGYLAEQVSGPAAPFGYTLVWFARTEGDVFTMNGYNGVSRESAAAKIEVSRNQPGLFKHAEFALGMESAPPEADANFAPMFSGLAISDPMQSVASGLPAEVLELYVQILGQGAAALSSESVETIDDPSCEESETEKVQARLASHIAQIEGIIASDGVNIPCITTGVADGCCWPRCGTTTLTLPAGPWASINPTGNPCRYSRPTTVSTVTCCVDFWCAVTCTTTTAAGTPQTGSCLGNNSGNCPPTPPVGCTP